MVSVKTLKSFSQILLGTIDIPIFIYQDTSTAYDRQTVITALQHLRHDIIKDTARSRSISTSVMYVINGVNHFYDENVEAAQECFITATAVCQEIETKSQLVDIFLSARIQLFSTLIISDYFLNEFCHQYPLGCESINILEALFRQPQLQVAVDDEFAPLLYPRTFGHSHLTRMPILREMSRLNGLVMERFQRFVPVRISAKEATEVTCCMKHVANAPIYQLPRLRHVRKASERSSRDKCKSKRRVEGKRHHDHKHQQSGDDMSILRVTAIACICTGREWM